MKEKPPQSYKDFSRIEVGTGARKKSIQSPTLYVSKEAIYLLNANWRLRTRYLKDPLLEAHEKCLILEDKKSRNKFKCFYGRSSSFHSHGRSHKKSKLSYGDENIPPSVEKIASSIQALIDKRKKKMNKKNGLNSDAIDERSDFEKRGRSQNSSSNHRQPNRFNQPRNDHSSLSRFGGTKKQRKISQQLRSFERDKEYWSSDDEEIAETVDTRDDEEISYPLENHEKENEDEQHNDESPELMDEDKNELPEEPSYENDNDEELSETMNDELKDDEESILPKKKDNKLKKKRRLQRVSQINKKILQDDEHSEDDLVDSDDDDVIPSSSRKSFSNQSTTSAENMSVAVTDEEGTLTEETQVIETKKPTQPSDQSTPKKTGPISAFFNSIQQSKTFQNKASTPSKNRTKEPNTSTTPTKTSQSKSKQQQLITTTNVKLSTPSKTTTIVNPYLKKSVKVLYHHGGLRNLGNSCYINSSLQLLFSLPSFFDTLKKSNGLFSEGQLYKSLMELYDQVAPPSQKGCMTCSATSIKKIMDKLSPRFAGFQQHDAHEFISEFLDSLHEELKKKSKAVLLEKEKKISSLLQTQQVQTKPPPPQAQAVLPVVEKVVSLIEDSPEREDVAKNAEEEDDGDVVIQKKTDDNMEKNVKAPVSSIVLPTDAYFCMKIKVCLTCDKCGYSR